MAFLRIRETKSGKYHYKVEAFWDKDKKQPRKKETYLGKENPKTGKVAPVRELNLNLQLDQVRDYGSVASCRFIAEEIGILESLREAFGEEQAELLFLLSVFVISEMMPLSCFEKWIDGVKHQYTGNKSILTSSGISSFLNNLGSDVGKRLDFLEKIVELNKGNFTTALIDITSISTYSQVDGWSAYGYNRDAEKMPQVNLQLVALEPCGLPVALRMTEGSISDTSTLSNAILLLESLGIKEVDSIMNRGFFSNNNLKELSDTGINVTIPVPSNNLIFQKAINLKSKDLKGAKNTFSDGKSLMIHTSFESDELGKNYTFHLYLNETRQTEENKHLYLELEEAEKEFKNKSIKTKLEAKATMKKILPKTKLKLFKLVVAEDGTFQLERNANAIAKEEKKSGYMLLLTDNKTKSGIELLETYRSRDSIEKLFDNLKNSLELDRLRSHSYEVVEGKLFIALISMMLHSELQKRLSLSKKEIKRRLSPREVLLDLRKIKSVTLPGGTEMIAEVPKKQRYAMSLLKIPDELFLSRKI